MSRVVPEYISSYEALTGLCGSLIAITTVVAALRIRVRHLQKAGIGADDWMILPAWLAFIGLNTCVLIGVHLKLSGYSVAVGTAAHASPVTNAALMVTLNSFTTICLGFVKISALLFYKRVFCPGKRISAFSVILNTLLGIVSVWIVVFFILQFAQCGSHFDGFWRASVFARYCHINTAYNLSYSITDLILDVLVVLMPMPKIWSLQMSVRRRLATTFVFLTAFLTIGVSAARLSNVNTQIKRQFADTALANSSLNFFQVFEAGMGLVTVNLPSLWFLHTKTAPERFLRNIRSILSLGNGSSRPSLRDDAAAAAAAAANGSEKHVAAGEREGAGSINSREHTSGVWAELPAEGSMHSVEAVSVSERKLSYRAMKDDGSQKGIQVTKHMGQTVETV